MSFTSELTMPPKGYADNDTYRHVQDITLYGEFLELTDKSHNSLPLLRSSNYFLILEAQIINSLCKESEICLNLITIYQEKC